MNLDYFSYFVFVFKLSELMRGQLLGLQDRLQTNLIGHTQLTQQTTGQSKDKQAGDQVS